MPPDDPAPRGDLLLVLVVYVLPLAAVTVLLVAVDLVVLAVGLLAVEAVVAGLVVLARRRPAPSRGRPARHPLAVPAAMAGLLVVMGGVAVLAARAG